MIALVGMPGPFELIVIALVVLLLFGNRLPDLMRSLGRSVVEFKKGVSDTDEHDRDHLDSEDRRDRD